MPLLQIEEIEMQPTGHAQIPQEPVEDISELSVLARLKRLEDIVIGKGSTRSNNQPVVSVTNTSSPRLAYHSPTSEYEEAVHILQETCIRGATWASPRSLDIRIVSTHQIALDQEKIFHSHSVSRSICLPPRAEALLLFDHYFKAIDLLQHVVHVPTVQTMMGSVYASLENGLPVVPSDIVLLLAIFASAASLCSYYSGDTEGLLLPADATQAAIFWTNSSLELLEFTRRTAARRLTDVQAGVILGFLLFHSEGFSTRARSLFASGVAMARDLSLHKIDAPGNSASGSSNQQTQLDTEIKRRVWWHVVATDWVLSLSGGPQEGTYFVQPRHFRVNMPRNLDDEDLERETPIERPLAEPTAMSYYIQRIKLADICRQVVDKMPFTSHELAAVDYQDVINLDRKFEAFFQDLPSFFKIDEYHVRQSVPLMRERPHMQIQRYALGMIAATRRAKLHQPFLIRRSLEDHYDYSRRISLQSARSVIRSKDLLEIEDQSEHVVVSAKHTGVVYHIFMATVVLVMDLCFNKAAAGEDDAARKAEVVAACKILEEAKCQSAMASEFLDSLMDVLRKHKVRLHSHNWHDENVVAVGTKETSVSELPCLVQQPTPVDMPPVNLQPQTMYDTSMSIQEDTSQHCLSDFDQIWKEYVELGPNMDMPGWDNLFSDLDSRF